MLLDTLVLINGWIVVLPPMKPFVHERQG